MADNTILLIPYARRGFLHDRLTAVLAAVRAVARHPHRPTEEPYRPPRRPAFVEDAAMAREMLRL